MLELNVPVISVDTSLKDVNDLKNPSKDDLELNSAFR
jgi:hypothetical protein